MRQVEYRIVRAADGRPLVILESPLGSGQELRPDALRRMASELIKIAELADSAPMGRTYIPSVGNFEF